MTSASGNARARAYARGVELPPAGSLQDRLLQEVDFRERNLTYALVGYFTRVLVRGFGLHKDPDALAELTEMHDLVEAEIYQDAYTPTYQRLAQARARRKREAVQRDQRRNVAAFKRVEEFGKEPTEKPTKR